MMDFKKIILILIPTLIAPILLLPFAFLNMIFPIGLDTIRIVFYIGLPIINIVFLALIIWKFKIILDLTMTILSIGIGFIYLILTFFFLKGMLVPSLTQVVQPSTNQPALEMPAIIRNSILIASSYLAFILGLFISQMVKNKIFKIVIFLLTGFGVSLIIFNPIILFLFTIFF